MKNLRDVNVTTKMDTRSPDSYNSKLALSTTPCEKKKKKKINLHPSLTSHTIFKWKWITDLKLRPQTFYKRAQEKKIFNDLDLARISQNKKVLTIMKKKKINKLDLTKIRPQQSQETFGL